MKQFVQISFLLLFYFANSQDYNFNWVYHINGSFNEVMSSQIDTNGNLYVSGIFSDGQFDELTGSITFTKTTGDIVFLERDGAFLAKYLDNGNMSWAIPIYENAFGSINIESLDIDNIGNIYLLGNYNGSIVFDLNGQDIILSSEGNNSSDDSFIAKYANDGTLLWVKDIKGMNADEAKAISISNDGTSFYVTGDFNVSIVLNNVTYNSSGFSDVFISKFDSSGNHVWDRTFGNSNSDYSSDIYTLQDNSFYTIGSFRGTVNFGQGSSTPYELTSIAFEDNYIAKYNQNGEPIWVKQLEGGINLSQVEVDNNGNIFITGDFSGNIDFNPDPAITYEIQSNNNQRDAFILKLDSDGIFSWANSFGGNDTDLATSLGIDSNNDITIGGMLAGSFIFTLNDTEQVSVSSNGGLDCFALKYNQDGTPISFATFGGNDTDYLNTLRFNNDKFFLAGRFKNNVDFDPNDGNNTVSNTNNNANGFILGLDSSTLSSPEYLKNGIYIRVYPNPTQGLIFIDANSNYNLPTQLIIRNNLGQLVGTYDLDNLDKAIDIKGLSGIYFLELYSGSELLQTSKIIKN